MKDSFTELLLDSASKEVVAGLFSVLVSSGKLILAIGDSSGLVPVADNELLSQGFGLECVLL